MTFFELLLIGIGGFFGAIIRYCISSKMNDQKHFPTGTLLVNLTGALLIGIILGLGLPLWVTMLMASGFAGALTTFSTMNKELIELWINDEKHHAILYLLLTYGGGIALAAIGFYIV